MNNDQDQKNEKPPLRASISYRIAAGVIFILIASFFTYMFLGAKGTVDLRSRFGVCAFKQTYQLPCPGCGWTTSTLQFVQGQILDSIYTQPAAAVFSLLLTISAVIALLSACLGIRFSFLDRPFGVIVKYVVIAVIIIIAGGWMVTLARALASNEI